MAHPALKELFPAQVIPFEQPAPGGDQDRPRTVSTARDASRPPLQDRTSTNALGQDDLIQASKVLTQAALTHRAYEDDVRKLASRVDEMVEQFEAKLKQSDNGRREAEKRAQAAELRAAEAEKSLRRLHDEIMRLFGSAKS